MGLFSKSKSPTPGYQSGPPAYSVNPPSNNNNNYAPPSPPRQPVNSDTRPLPNGWISQYDPNSKKFFYVYTPTALRQWEHPVDKPMNSSGANRGENSSYLNQQPQQQPYYGNQQQQPQHYYPQQPQYQPQYQQPHGQQPIIVQQPVQSGASRFGGGGAGFGTMAAAGLGGGLLGYMIGDAVGEHDRPDIIENNYYNDNDNYYGDNNDNWGEGGGGFDGGFDDGGFDMF